MNHSFLILTHKPIDHIYAYARFYQESNFYIHIDKKSDIRFIKTQELNNIHFIDDVERVDIKWAGFSMVQATINLISYALKHDEKNEYFHLISGDDVLLSKELSWDSSDIFMECRDSQEHRYRIRFDTPHADTKYQRTLAGKVLTQYYKIIDKILPINEKFYFGSQWFSIRKNELKILMKSITSQDLDFFKNKLCPDEHFFQYLIIKNNMLNKIHEHGNKRFIKFDPNFQHGSSPIYLNLEQLINAQKENYWFARKVKLKEMQEFYLISDEA